MNLLAVVAEHNKSLELCHLLGLTEKIPCFIQNLIAKQKHLEVVKFARADTKALSYTSSVGRASTCMSGHFDAMAAILVSMGGKNLQAFLNNHWKEQELLCIEISRALKISSDSGMLVLEALEGFYPTEHHSEEILLDVCVIRKSCIFLLEQLMILSPKLQPEAKLEARKLKQNHPAILGFLLLVDAYGLASAFNKDDLKSLCYNASQNDNADQIFHVLSIAGERPHIERSTDPSKNEPLFNNVEMKCRGCDLISGCSLSFIHCVSDPAKVVLDALQKCRSANLGKYGHGLLGFIEKLIMRKQWLLAIRYIYVYELVHLFPPVRLLKEYVEYAEELAKKIHDKGLGSREAQEKAINCEISALRAAIKSIMCHSLQSEYSPDHPRARIAKLQRQMADLRIPNKH